jgi:hypothetical protein
MIRETFREPANSWKCSRSNPKAEFVFNLKGERIESFRKAWKSACHPAKLPELLFHDLRRTGVRNLVRAGVPERVAMAISGHRTRSTFERYNITSERDLREAAKKLETYINGQAKPAQEAIPILAPSDPKGSEQSETEMNDLYGDSANKSRIATFSVVCAICRNPRIPFRNRRSWVQLPLSAPSLKSI